MPAPHHTEPGRPDLGIFIPSTYKSVLEVIMTDRIYRRMLLRRRFCKRVCIIIICFAVSYYSTILLFGELRSTSVMSLTDLGRCPACYGVSVCPELYSNQITIEDNGWSSFFNAKNVYYGYTKSNRKVVLKKLAHDWELEELDSRLCKRWNLPSNCKPMDLVNGSNIDEKIVKLVQLGKMSEDTPGQKLILCPYAYSIYDFVQPALNAKANNKFDRMYIWTMLKINPEPIILQVIPKTRGWPVPAYGGVCGRLELVAYEGISLSALMHVEWHRKLKYARKILDAAMDFTYKHERYRFYLKDWSIDNIVANDKDEITFVDLEDFIILDKHISPRKEFPNWYERYRSPFGSLFAMETTQICQHHLSDHNIWAACHVLANDHNPLLYPIPKKVNDTRPHFDRLLSECLHGHDRFRTVTKLQSVMDDMLADERVVGYGARPPE